MAQPWVWGSRSKAWPSSWKRSSSASTLYGWKRLRPRTHFVLGLALPPVGILGAASVPAANAWMNTPGGVTFGPNGELTSVDVLGALFTKAQAYEFWHFIIAIYLTTSFTVASIYAVAWLGGRRDHYQRLAFAVPFTIAAFLATIQVVVGDLSARGLVTDQPSKFAAMEINWNARSHNPEVIGGLLNDTGGGELRVPFP